MSRPGWLCDAVAWVDYRVLLPLLSRLPPWAAKWFIRLRGLVNFLFDLEWRTLALRQGYMRDATLTAMRALATMGSTSRSPRSLTLQRFVTASWEEYDALRLARIDYSRLQWHGSGVEKLLETVRAGRGVVLLTGHFDSLYVGLVVLAKHGVRVNLMSSSIISGPSVPKPIRHFFAAKRAALNAHFHPGSVMDFEDGLKPFSDALKRGEIVVAACDGPSTTPGRGSVVRFLGADHVMAAGPEFFARKARAPVSMFTCVREADGRFRIDCSEPVQCDAGGMQLAYDRLDECIRRDPGKWWAADLYRSYPKAEAGTEIKAAKVPAAR